MTSHPSRAAGPVRLERSSSRGAQVGCALVLGVLLGGLGTFFLVMYFRNPDEGANSWVIPVVGGGFALVGYLLLFAAVQQFLALRTPETVLDLSPSPLAPGEAALLAVSQSGPVNLRSLRANVLCEETVATRRYNSNSRQTETSYDQRVVFQMNVLEVNDVRVGRGEVLRRDVTFSLPPDARSTTGAREGIHWRIEVWGRVRRWADFMHPFTFIVESTPKSKR